MCRPSRNDQYCLRGKGRGIGTDLERGLSLVELLIALTLGLIVIAAILQFFVGSKVTYSATEAMARVQESGRFAMATLQPVVRSASLNGICGGTTSPRLRSHVNTSSADAFSLLAHTHAIRGWEYQETGTGRTVTLSNLEAGASEASDWLHNGTIGALPEEIVDRALPLSDVLLVREMLPIPGVTAADTNNNLPNQPIAISSGVGTDRIRQCEIILVTNCNEADLFQVSNANTTTQLLKDAGGPCSPGNLSSGEDWSTSYRSATQFYRPVARAFFVGEGVGGEPALFSASFGTGFTSPRFEELVDGVENMQLLFGYSEPGAPAGSGDGQRVDRWVTAQNVPNWEYVIAARVGLLVRSPGPVGTGSATQTYEVGLTNVTHPADNTLRQAYNATVTLRNRQIVK